MLIAAPRVVLTGPESTGKTWLVERLAAELAVPFSAEAARAVAAERGGTLGPDDIDAVARRQIALEQEAVAAARARAAPLVLHDTDLVSTVVYGRFYNGSCPEWIERAALERRSDLYLLLATDVPFTPEPGQRGTAAERDAQAPLFRHELARISARAIEIGGSWQERLDRARREVSVLASRRATIQPARRR